MSFSCESRCRLSNKSSWRFKQSFSIASFSHFWFVLYIEAQSSLFDDDIDGSGRWRSCSSVSVLYPEVEGEPVAAGDKGNNAVRGDLRGLTIFTTTSGGGNPEPRGGDPLVELPSCSCDFCEEEDDATEPGGVADIVDSSQSSPTDMVWMLPCSLCMLF